MPDNCKCGGTTRLPINRCRELSNTSLPLKCNIEYSIKVNNYKKAEKYIHDKIISAGFMRYEGREWFKCKPADIKHIFDEYIVLYPYDENYKKPNEQPIIKNITINNITINTKDDNGRYICNSCNYDSGSRTGMCNHKKTKKHLLNLEKANLAKEDEKIVIEKQNKEINELKQELLKLKQEKDTLEIKVKIYKDIVEKR